MSSPGAYRCPLVGVVPVEHFRAVNFGLKCFQSLENDLASDLFFLNDGFLRVSQGTIDAAGGDDAIGTGENGNGYKGGD